MNVNLFKWSTSNGDISSKSTVTQSLMPIKSTIYVFEHNDSLFIG